MTKLIKNDDKKNISIINCVFVLECEARARALTNIVKVTKVSVRLVSVHFDFIRIAHARQTINDKQTDRSIVRTINELTTE